MLLQLFSVYKRPAFARRLHSISIQSEHKIASSIGTSALHTQPCLQLRWEWVAFGELALVPVGVDFGLLAGLIEQRDLVLR